MGIETMMCHVTALQYTDIATLMHNTNLYYNILYYAQGSVGRAP
jgi:hypothetical protein